MSKWYAPSTWFKSPEMVKAQRSADEAGISYQSALARLKSATDELRQTTSTSLDALDRKVLESDKLMRDALRHDRRSKPG